MTESSGRDAIEPGLPLSAQVYRILKQAIVCAELPPGERLSDIDLARELEISRQPIREAFLRLQTDDLLDVRPQRGTYVKRISVTAVKDARFVREAIEADIVTLLAQEADAAVVRELEQQLAAQRGVLQSAPQQFMKLDDEFHRTLAEGAGKPYAWRVIEGVKTQMDRVRFLSFNHYHVERLIHQHALVVEAIANGRSVEAMETMRMHLRGILDSIHEIAGEYPAYFEEGGVESFS
ncbi:GntR family transcriptional regulator [Granulosicoccus sp. 3-233]|uniref:GntR family transcriptional regulator n=1 Tax=Granulosicoccus sp. 3-233 TaxID=3417969 RepID=UPI003D34E92C